MCMKGRTDDSVNKKTNFTVESLKSAYLKDEINS